MKVVIFHILPFPSHYTACFGFARYWQNKKYKVVFTGNENLRELVEIEGFEFYKFQYLSEYNIKSFKAFLGLFLKTIIDKNLQKVRFKEFYSAKQAAEQLYKTFQPTHIFIDEHFSEYYFFFKKYNSDISIITTKLSTKKVKGIPPLDVDFNPLKYPKLISNIVVEFIWQKHFFKLKYQEFIQKIAFLNRHEVYFWKRLCEKKGDNYENLIDRKHSFYKCIKGLPTIILAPEKIEFDFRTEQKNEIYFHTTITKNEEKYKTTQYQELLSFIRNNPEFKIIYCAFGTLSGVNANVVINFYAKLITVLDTLPNTILVISRGKVNFESTQHSRIKVFDFIPQIDFLQHVDLMISHGGLGTIKECFDAKVPMLIYPLNLKIDQVGNGIRIEANKLGIAGNLRNDTSEMIRTNIIKGLKNQKNLKMDSREINK